MAIIGHEPRITMSEAKVYFIQCQETKRVKIGIAHLPIARLTQLQTMSPTKIELILSVEGSRELDMGIACAIQYRERGTNINDFLAEFPEAHVLHWHFPNTRLHWTRLSDWCPPECGGALTKRQLKSAKLIAQN